MSKLIDHDGLRVKILEGFKQHIQIYVSLLLIVPLGFSTKFYSGCAQSWVRDSLGGVFYEIFWCLVVHLFWRRLRVGVIVTIVLVVTCCLEFLQLWHPPFLEYLRGNFIGRTILGTSFSWSDFPYYLIGCGIGWPWLKKLKTVRDYDNIRYRPQTGGTLFHLRKRMEVGMVPLLPPGNEARSGSAAVSVQNQLTSWHSHQFLLAISVSEQMDLLIARA